MRSWLSTSLCLLALVPMAATSAKADSVEDFYKGKTIRAIIGYSTGGGYDTYTRLLAAHMSKHIPGNPTVVPENMPGAGSLKAANYIYNVAPKDGTVFGTFARGMPMYPLLDGTAVKFDASKFGWLGSITNEASVCVTGADSKVKTWDDASKVDFTVAGEGSGSDPDIFATMLKNLFDLKMKLVTGYPGTNEMTMAIQRGETDGRCGWSWNELKTSHADWLTNKQVNVILQLSLEPMKDLPDVPNVMAVAKDDSQRDILKLVLARQEFGRPYATPPGVPEDRLAALRKAFEDTMADPEFLSQAKASGLEVDPVNGEGADALIKEIYATPKSVIDQARKVIAD